MLNFLKKHWSTLVLLILLLLFIFVFGFVKVSGQSMYPTLEDGDYGFILKAGYTLEQGDITVAKVNGKLIIKRVIGCPGDTVFIDTDGSVYVNGELFDSDPDSYMDTPYCGVEITLDDDEYFLMGDNRGNSTDSRIVGPVSTDQIIGKIVWTQ